MSQEILFKRVQLESLELPTQHTQEPFPSTEMPYTLGQAAEVREYAIRRRNQLLDQGGPVRNMNIEADLVQSAIVSLEDQMHSEMTSEEAFGLIWELKAREQGFMNAGVEQTGLQPPKSYRRIGAVAAGFVRNIEQNQLHTVTV